MPKTPEEVGEEAAQSTTAVNAMVGIRRSEFVKSLGILVKTAAKQPKPFIKHLGAYGKELFEITKGTSELAPHPKDRRFQDKTWSENPIYKRGLQSWLAMQRELKGWVEDSGATDADKVRANFILDILIDSFAPTNTLIGNPAAIKKLYETGGGSVLKGLKNAYRDLRENGGLPRQVDERPFKVGENLACSKGAVVFKNEMFELIQYQPQTSDVYKIPLLVVPPQINKYYALDLAPNKSMVRFLTSMGFQVFVISWRNPTRQLAHWGMEDYVKALIDAMNVTKKVTRSKKINISGACSGGITLAMFLSTLAARGDDSINAFTLMVCVLNARRSDTESGHFVTEAAIETARKHSRKKGILQGDELGRVFAWMRPNDLIWNYVVNNYLLGEDPPPFDVLYWNNDSTNLPAQLHSDYLDLFLNKPFRPDTDVEFLDHKVDLKAVKQDGFMVAGVTDHITPWKACYRNIDLFGGDIDFVLANKGHLQALLSVPGTPKAQFFTAKPYPETADEWLPTTQGQDGSWWPYWAEWLGKRSGEMKTAPKILGNKAYPAQLKAPGEYVFT